eukprot:5401507-Pleurochrysis_carterae.AAC.1
MRAADASFDTAAAATCPFNLLTSAASLCCSTVHWPAACTAPDERRSPSASCVAAAAASRLKRK